MFQPPRCPNAHCQMHLAPEPGFFIRRGSYRSSVKPHPIPRFRCRVCAKGFSRQTFRHDYRDRKPHLNVRVMEELCSGVGYRQSARIVGLTRRNFVNKARKIQRTAGKLDMNLLARAGEVDQASPREEPLRLQFDEFETYETCRNTMPLTVPVGIETESRLILGAVSASIRPRGKMTEKRLRRIALHQERYGPREDRSAEACRDVFKRMAMFRPAAPSVVLDTDCKSTYSGYAVEAFQGKTLRHRTTLGSAPRSGDSELAGINTTEAIMRDHTGRLRRESWLVSKKGRYLNAHLGLHAAWRNWVRPRFNRDSRCPGEIAGFARRRLSPGELVGWRQDWGPRSPSPYGDGARSVAEEWSPGKAAA